jgi:hypothetical protein
LPRRRLCSQTINDLRPFTILGICWLLTCVPRKKIKMGEIKRHTSGNWHETEKYKLSNARNWERQRDVAYTREQREEKGIMNSLLSHWQSLCNALEVKTNLLLFSLFLWEFEIYRSFYISILLFNFKLNNIRIFPVCL